MAAKKIKAQLKLVIGAGKANPAPPVGPALGSQGVNIMQFCKDFNAQTATMTGSIPVIVTVYDDRTFEFVLKTPAVSELIKQALNIQSGSKDAVRIKVGTLTIDQVKDIATRKMEDLNCCSVENAVKMVEGTARSMGVKVAK
jgi:large subunit ribosomal protein L11